MPIRVVLADDSALLRHGLGKLVEAVDDLDLVATADSYDTLVAAVDERRPDVVVTDIRMPPTTSDEGIRAANAFRASHPDMGVVVLSQHAEASYALALLEQGSAGRAYLLKDRVASGDELADAIRTVHAGGSVVDPTVVEGLVTRMRPKDSPLDSLTPREREVLAEVAQGRSNAAIAQRLFLTERAIEKHTNSIFSKLGLTEEPDLNRRVAAVLLYLERS